jgi:glycosyltransferase involved in cell wall biosynthesis
MTCLGRLGTRQLARWYTRAAIYASPARYEPFGLSALEAAFSGCALVLGDIPSLREVWGAAACYVEPDDSTALAASITALIDRTDQRASMAARAMTRARRYTLDAACDAYLTIYQELTGMRSQPAGMSECA